MAFTYAEDIVTIDDFSTDTLAAGKYTALQDAFGVWSIAGGQLAAANGAGAGRMLYRNDVAAADIKCRAEWPPVPGRTFIGVALRKPDNTGWMVVFPQDANNFTCYTFTSGFGFSNFASPAATTPSLVRWWELVKQGSELRVRSFKADLTLIDDIQVASGLSAGDQAAVCNPTLYAGAVNAPQPAFETARFSTLTQVQLPTIAHRRGGPRANIVHKTKAGGFRGGGGAPRPTVGILWPRGNRGR